MDRIFQRELIVLGGSYESQEDFFDKASALLYQRGMVEKNFAHALRQREQDYPTGLQTETYGVAIPHTDAAFVREPGIAFFRPDEPLTFSHMGEPTLPVRAEAVFVLAVKDPKEQVAVLEALIRTISNQELMGRIMGAASEAELESLLNNEFACAGQTGEEENGTE